MGREINLKKDQYINNKYPFGFPPSALFSSFDPKVGITGNCIAGKVRKKLKRSSFGQKTGGKALESQKTGLNP